MKNIFKTSLVLFACMLASAAMYAETFSVDEIIAGATKSSITVRVDAFAKATGKQICKESSTTKAEVVEVKNTANNIDEKFVEIKASSDISALKLHAVINNAAAKNIAMVCWGDVTPTTDNTIGAQLINLPGYAGACNANYVDINIPAGTRIIRLYRQVKGFNGTGYEKSAKYGDGSTFYLVDMEVTAGPAAPVISKDATLSAITYNGTAVPDFTADKTNYEVELPAGTTAVPTVAATATDSKATVAITQASALPGNAIINVTAEDGTTTKQYTITFTVASAAPKVLTATWANIAGSATVDNVNKTISGQVKNGTGLTIEPQFTGNNIQSWTPTGAQDFSKGTINYTFTSGTGETTCYAVTISEAPAMSTDATLKSITISGYTINFSPNTYTYNIELKSGTTTAPSVTYTTNDGKANATITNASSVPGATKIVVTAEDGSTITYTINFTVAVPSSGLTTHYPEVYEAKDLAGGYSGKLTVFGGREYEVYYVSRDAESNITVATTPVEKVAGVCTSVSENETKAKDGWFTLSSNGTSGSTNGAAKDEFETSVRCAKLINNQALEMHIKGFDQFSFYGKDNNATESKGRHFEIYIDDVKQTMTPTTEYTIRRFDITTGEHVIRLVGIGSSNNEITSFSLRIAEEPRTKWIKGNDSTQVVMQTTAPKPVYYFTKYNAKGETKLIWDGPEATGITLTTHASGSIGDTLVLGGTANCPTGTYNYHVAAFYNGLETSRANGKFIVASEIKALTDTMVDAYQNEEMDQIQFRYYALSDADVTLTWTGATPAGITGSGSNGKYIIGGTPTTVGTYDFVISVTGGNSIKGKIIVRALDLGNDPVLYLYKNNLAYEQDGIYEYLTSAAGGKKNLIARKAREDGLRPAEQYAKYKWVLISEDVDANNAEVLAIAEGGANLPVLNLKSFTYAPGRLDWGEPDNGSITDNARSITVLRADHPIFASMAGISQGQKIDILSAINKKGLMPAAIDYEGTLCLATAWTRDINNYTGDGVQETFLHEVPAEMRGGKKYICLPIALQSSKNLSANGKKLISSVINYLLSSKATIDLPELKITSFKINGVAGTIDQANNTINVSFDITKNPTLDLTNIIPEVTVASQLTHAVPNNGEAVDFSKSSFAPVVYIVTDYINRRAYEVTVTTYNPEGIEDIYNVGEWVNIYDIYGRKVTTTNEDIYQMALPRGVYIVVLENGETFKIMR